jgi:hypothetical protein
MLFLMPVPKIKRSEIAEIVRLRGVIRRDRKRLLEMGRSVMARMQKGIAVEPSTTPVEVETRECDSGILTRLLVDGRPVDDFS